METSKIFLSQEEATALYKEYRREVHRETPMDAEIKRAYRAISKGQMIIKALESIAVAGLGADTLPKLAIMRADHSHCRVRMTRDGGAGFRPSDNRGRYIHTRGSSVEFDLPAGSFRQRNWDTDKMEAFAVIPKCPIHLRPKSNIHNYHVLWEAVWAKAPPVDPMLLRRIGVSDMWIVCAHWELTEVERAALATRI